jgi:putative membrane protein
MLLRLAVAWAVNAAALWVADVLFTGVRIDGWKAYLIGAAVLGIANGIIKPVLALLTLPLIILTLGLFLLVTNALMLLLTSKVADTFGLEFHVEGFWTAVFGALVISLASMVLESVLPDQR